jgi:hypothetical protein
MTVQTNSGTLFLTTVPAAKLGRFVLLSECSFYILISFDPIIAQSIYRNERVSILDKGKKFSSPYGPNLLWHPPSLLSNWYRDKAAGGVKLSTHLHLVLHKMV